MRLRITSLTLVSFLLLPGLALARAPQSGTNVNSRYTVEGVSVAGIDESRLTQGLRDDMQKLVGNKYDPEATDQLARRMRRQLHDYTVSVKVKRGEHASFVKVTFEVERQRNKAFDLRVAPLLYTTNDSFSLSVVPTVETHHNVFAVGLVSDANDLLERNSGVTLRYEHHKVGTEMLQVGVEYDYYHPSFQPETEAALLARPDVPGIYRTREVFAPTVSVLPIPEIRVTFGASFQTLSMQYPEVHDQSANAFTLGVQFRQTVRPHRGLRHVISADYILRDATTTLESDFLYRRQFFSGDYVLTLGRNTFGFHGQGGTISGTPPLFERFSIGNATTLRGWDKFDVAPVGGTRLAYGSLDYSYRPFQVFYDVGAVWDPGQPAEVRHSIGVGLAWRNGFFVSLGIPLRYHSVTPAFMFGFRM